MTTNAVDTDNGVRTENDARFFALMLSSGYSNVRRLPSGSWAGTMKQITDAAIMVGLDPTGWSESYSYASEAEAADALGKWAGMGHPPGDWVRHVAPGLQEYNAANVALYGRVVTTKGR